VNLRNALDLDGAEVPGMGGLPFKFTPSSLVAGIVFGLVGWYFFKEAKKEGNFWNILIGLAMMTYSLLITGSIMVWVVGGVLFYLAWINR
jgi:hypothetical protein